MDIEKVWVKHAKLDDGQRVRQVPKAALPHYYRSGWELTDAPPPPPLPEAKKAPARAGASSSEPPGEPADQKTEAPEPPGLSHVKDQAPSGRRASKKESD